MSDETVRAVDLFCGAGGISTGLALACESLDREVELVAVNHWTTAIETHQQNHPWAEHRDAKVEELHPPDVAPPGEVDILVAAPECTHFSNARGGKPVDEQKRASPWHVVDWAQKVRPTNILLENVPELESWGPVDEDGQPTRNGELFEAWVNSLHALGYSVDWRVLNAADYGDATSRERLFVVGRLGKRAEFPEPSHSQDGAEPGTEAWRPASEIIDWSDPGESIWGRSRPLVNNTMQRIAEGIRRHCGETFEPFADAMDDLEKKDVTQMQKDAVPLEELGEVVEEPGEPFLVKYYGTSTARPLDAPMDTITASGQKFALATPYLLGQQSGSTPQDVTREPVPTIATRGAISKVEPRPFVLPRNLPYRGIHSNATYDPRGRPLHTVTAKNHDGHVVNPSLMRFSHGGALLDRTQPLPTITTARCGDFAISQPQPFLVEYYGNGSDQPVDEPLPTVTTKDRFALILPDHLPWGLDIRFRMLQPRELAAAMGFPADYEIRGNKTETVKQIGNAVPVHLARALCRQLLVGDAPSLMSYPAKAPPERGEADD